MKGQSFPVSTALLLACLCVMSVHSLPYSEIEMLGVQTCPHLDSCRFNQKANFTERNCECDDQCAFYNDCCIDAPAPRSRTRTRQKCMAFGNAYLGAYVLAECPADYSGPVELVRQCQNDNLNDPFLSAPVTDPTGRRTYLNRYCAQCNDAPPLLTPWLVLVDCDVPMSQAGKYTWSELSYRSGRWTVRHRGQTYPCDLIFDKPEQLPAEPRLCRTNMTSNCSPRWRRRTYDRMCNAYVSPVVSMDLVVYRNPHCALCNNATVDDLMCVTYGTMGRGRKPFSFALLLDVNRSDGDLVGVSRTPSVTCPSGEKYDPFFKKCRPLVCAIPGYTLSNGKCVKP